jgi:hypothetical protein
MSRCLPSVDKRYTSLYFKTDISFMARIDLTAFLFVIVTCQEVVAQEQVKQTSSIIINGRVKSPKTFTADAIRQYKIYNVGDVEITNHKGEVKGTAKELSGILLRDLLQSIEPDAESPKALSEYYFTCIASDGYKVVFSWNELFNTATGNTVYIVTSKDHKSIEALDESILLISTADVRTGRRYVKNLQSIIVRRAE